MFRKKRPGDYPPVSEGEWLEASDGRPALRSLPGADAARLRQLAGWFLATRDWIDAGDARPERADRVSISLLACLPILRLGHSWYDGWSTVVITQDSFADRVVSMDGAGVVTEYDDELSGLATGMGPVVLSLRDVRESGYPDGFDVVIHEMAHKLDERDGEANGCPPLPRGIGSEEWRAAFSSAYGDFRGRVGRSRGGRSRRSATGRLPLDEYAAESPEEFFAVACEHFFHTPRRLELAYPAVHRLLSEFFGSGG